MNPDLKTLFQTHIGALKGNLNRRPDPSSGPVPAPDTNITIQKIGNSGSNRTYYRLSTPQYSCIGVEGTDAQENHTFIALARHFASIGINVPQIYAVSPDGMSYLQEDLGTESLFDRIAEGRKRGTYSEHEKELLKRTIAALPKIQIQGAEDWDFGKCYHGSRFDRRSIMFDLNYFKYCFLKSSGIEFDEEKLEDDFIRLAEELLKSDGKSFMYRDFQSRNVMIKDGQPYFIDFQGGRMGPVYYDVASFVWQARSNFPQPLKEELVDTYIQALDQYRPTNPEEFWKTLRIFVFFRTLQVLGAYGFRGKFGRKEHFLQSIPYAVANLEKAAADVESLCPYLVGLARRLSADPACQLPHEDQDKILKIRVFSFSYKRGVPQDESGNGGGYVFDCRAIHNPGRYPEYKDKTGMDAEVKAFLEAGSEIGPFLDNVYALADAHVEKYMSRGFTNLMFSFGCTGGQHRSVYCAEALSAHLNDKYGLKIRLIHREQGIEKKFNF